MLANTQTVKDNIKENSKEMVLEFLRKFIFIAILFVVFYPPYLRGLFFEQEQLPTEIFVFSIFILFWIYKFFKKDKRFLETPIEYAAFGFIIVYFISIFGAVDRYLAINEWLKYCMYFAVFFMFTNLIKTQKEKLAVLWVIVASAIGVALLGIDGAAGGHVANAFNKLFETLGLQIKFFSTFVDGRIYSTLQYPNTLAAYLMAVFFLSLGLISTASKLWTRLLASGVSFILLITFTFTLSRGAFIIMPIAFLIYFLFLGRLNRVKGSAYAMASIISVLLVTTRLSGYISNPIGNEGKIWFTVLSGFVISVIFALLSGFLIKRFEMLSWKVYAVIVAIVSVLGLVGVIFVLNSSMPLELSHTNEQKDEQISVKRSVVLKPETEYKLVFDVTASMTGDKPDTYSVNIYSKSIKNIVVDENGIILGTISGKTTNGTEKKEITFKTPSDSRSVEVCFINSFQGTKALFDNAKILEKSSESLAKKLVLKYKYAPETIVSRFTGLAVNKSSIDRTIFYKDGFKIIKDYWLLGAGGGAWSQIYMSYQSYKYFSTQAHNYFLQLGIETGLIGLTAALLLIVSIFINFISEYRFKSDENNRLLQAAIFASITALFAHSLIDFDLSLSAVFLLLWELISVTNCRYRDYVKQTTAAEEYKLQIVNRILEKTHKLSKVKKLSLNSGVWMIATIIILTIPVMFLSSKSYAEEAIKAYKNKDVNMAIQYMKTSAEFPLSKVEYKMDYVNLLKTKKILDSKEISIIDSQVKKIESLSKYNWKLLAGMADYYFSKGDIEKGLSLINRSTYLRPLVAESWQQKIQASEQVAMFYIKNKDYKKAVEYISKTLGVVDEAREANKKNIVPFVLNNKTQKILERMKYLKDNLQSKESIDVSKVVFYNVADMDINLDNIPDQWTAYSNSPEIEFNPENNSMTLKNKDSGKEEYIQTRELELQPNKTYIIEVELLNEPGVNSIPYGISGITTSGELKRDGNLFVSTETVPSGFKGKNCVMVIGVSGRYDIKSIKILEK